MFTRFDRLNVYLLQIARLYTLCEDLQEKNLRWPTVSREKEKLLFRSYPTVASHLCKDARFYFRTLFPFRYDNRNDNKNNYNDNNSRYAEKTPKKKLYQRKMRGYLRYTYGLT